MSITPTNESPPNAQSAIDTTPSTPNHSFSDGRNYQRAEETDKSPKMKELIEKMLKIAKEKKAKKLETEKKS